jgi:hypothetical protein
VLNKFGNYFSFTNKFSIFILLSILFQGCATSPEALKKRDIEESFLKYTGKNLKRSTSVDVYKLSSIEKNEMYPEREQNLLAQDYKLVHYFISYEPDPACPNWYSVYEKCDSLNCSYQFILSGGFCE